MSMRTTSAADASRTPVKRFLWDCKADFDEKLVVDEKLIDCLSTLLYEEAVAPPSNSNCRVKSICEIVGSLLPSVNDKDLKDRIWTLLSEIRHGAAEADNDDLQGSEEIRATAALEAHFSNWCFSSAPASARASSAYTPLFASSSDATTKSLSSFAVLESSLGPSTGVSGRTSASGDISRLTSSSPGSQSLIGTRVVSEEWEQVGTNLYEGERGDMRVPISRRWNEKAGSEGAKGGAGVIQSNISDIADTDNGIREGSAGNGVDGIGNDGQHSQSTASAAVAVPSSSPSSLSSTSLSPSLSPASSSVVLSGPLADSGRSSSSSDNVTVEQQVSSPSPPQQQTQNIVHRQRCQDGKLAVRSSSSGLVGRQGTFSSLNPNATEFVPQTLKTSNGVHVDAKSQSALVTAFHSSGSFVPGAANRESLSFLGSQQSNISSADESEFWHDQLPDDLLPLQDELPSVDLLPPDDIFDYTDPISLPDDHSAPAVAPLTSTAQSSSAGIGGVWGLTSTTSTAQVLVTVSSSPAISGTAAHVHQSVNDFGFNGADQRLHSGLSQTYAPSVASLRYVHASSLREKTTATAGGAQTALSSVGAGVSSSFGAAGTFGGKFTSEQPQVTSQTQLVQPSGARERPQSQWLGTQHLDITSSLLEEASFPEEEDVDGDAVRALAAQFPGFSAESLADIYYANGGDLALTTDLLNQLELQEEVSGSSHLHPQPPSLTLTDFPALSAVERIKGHLQNGGMDVPGMGGRGSRLDDAELRGMGRGGPGIDVRGLSDFAAVVRKHAAQQAQWQLECNTLGEVGMGRGRNPVYASRGAGHSSEMGRGGSHSLKSDSYANGRGPAPPSLPPSQWLDTGSPVAALYNELREEASDHARIRNSCFQQATHAYLGGNKRLAKELGAQGQWHNEQMKAAHAKASEAIFRHRNAASGYTSGGPGQRGILDLHGLHVNEALPLLKRELAALRAASQRLRQRQQIFVCVGTGHHTRGVRTQARLPAAVERCLAEEEQVHFAEAKPGLLHVVI